MIEKRIIIKFDRVEFEGGKIVLVGAIRDELYARDTITAEDCVNGYSRIVVFPIDREDLICRIICTDLVPIEFQIRTGIVGDIEISVCGLIDTAFDPTQGPVEDKKESDFDFMKELRAL